MELYGKTQIENIARYVEFQRNRKLSADFEILNNLKGVQMSMKNIKGSPCQIVFQMPFPFETSTLEHEIGLSEEENNNVKFTVVLYPESLLKSPEVTVTFIHSKKMENGNGIL